MDDRVYAARLREFSPIDYVHAGIPPFLLIHGTADKTVPYAQSPMLCEKIKSVRGSCEIIAVEGADHGIGKWEENPAYQAYKTKMIHWLRANLRINAARHE
jgi:alpha-L-fucosidase 2